MRYVISKEDVKIESFIIQNSGVNYKYTDNKIEVKTKDRNIYVIDCVINVNENGNVLDVVISDTIYGVYFEEIETVELKSSTGAGCILIPIIKYSYFLSDTIPFFCYLNNNILFYCSKDYIKYYEKDYYYIEENDGKYYLCFINSFEHSKRIGQVLYTENNDYSSMYIYNNMPTNVSSLVKFFIDFLNKFYSEYIEDFENLWKSFKSDNLYIIENMFKLFNYKVYDLSYFTEDLQKKYMRLQYNFMFDFYRNKLMKQLYSYILYMYNLSGEIKTLGGANYWDNFLYEIDLNYFNLEKRFDVGLKFDTNVLLDTVYAFCYILYNINLDKIYESYVNKDILFIERYVKNVYIENAGFGYSMGFIEENDFVVEMGVDPSNGSINSVLLINGGSGFTKNSKMIYDVIGDGEGGKIRIELNNVRDFIINLNDMFIKENTFKVYYYIDGIRYEGKDDGYGKIVGEKILNTSVINYKNGVIELHFDDDIDTDTYVSVEYYTRNLITQDLINSITLQIENIRHVLNKIIFKYNISSFGYANVYNSNKKKYKSIEVLNKNNYLVVKTNENYGFNSNAKLNSKYIEDSSDSVYISTSVINTYKFSDIYKYLNKINYFDVKYYSYNTRSERQLIYKKNVDIGERVKVIENVERNNVISLENNINLGSLFLSYVVNGKEYFVFDKIIFKYYFDSGLKFDEVNKFFDDKSIYYKTLSIYYVDENTILDNGILMDTKIENYSVDSNIDYFYVDYKYGKLYVNFNKDVEKMVVYYTVDNFVVNYICRFFNNYKDDYIENLYIYDDKNYVIEVYFPKIYIKKDDYVDVIVKINQ